MNRIKDFFSNMNEEVKVGLTIAFAAIFIFSLGNFAGSLTNITAVPEEGAGVVESVEDTTAAPVTVAPTTAAPVTQAPTTAAPVTQAPTTEAPTTAAPATDAVQPSDTTAAPSTGAPSTKGEIIALFNESANKIKTNATKATRNYQDIQVVKMELPSALQALGDTLLTKFVTPNFTPLEWTGADIAENYPVGGKSYVSQLTEADLADATCTDNGTEYEVVIKINPETNPVYGSGMKTNAIFWVMNPDDISENVPGLQSCNIEYHDCTVTAKIDKATGNMTYAKYNFYFDIDVSIKVLATLNAAVDVLVDEEYTIAY